MDATELAARTAASLRSDAADLLMRDRDGTHEDVEADRRTDALEAIAYALLAIERRLDLLTEVSR